MVPLDDKVESNEVAFRNIISFKKGAYFDGKNTTYFRES